MPFEKVCESRRIPAQDDAPCIGRFGEQRVELAPETFGPADDERFEGVQKVSGRSEEHTSELHSPCNLVCRLLLEKKKQDLPLCLLITFFFFFNDTATTEIYTLSLHDALPISCRSRKSARAGGFQLKTMRRALGASASSESSSPPKPSGQPMTSASRVSRRFR